MDTSVSFPDWQDFTPSHVVARRTSFMTPGGEDKRKLRVRTPFQIPSYVSFLCLVYLGSFSIMNVTVSVTAFSKGRVLLSNYQN